MRWDTVETRRRARAMPETWHMRMVWWPRKIGGQWIWLERVPTRFRWLDSWGRWYRDVRHPCEAPALIPTSQP